MRLVRVIMMALVAGGLATGCTTAGAPSTQKESTSAISSQDMPDAINHCPRVELPENPNTLTALCPMGNTTYLQMSLTKETFDRAPKCDGIELAGRDNGDGTWTITWSTTKPDVKVYGGMPLGWSNNLSTEKDPIFQSPYTTAKGQTEVALIISAPRAPRPTQSVEAPFSPSYLEVC